MSAAREHAQIIMQALEHAGYQAYLVGGCVRDLLLSRPVHDYDIATSASPEQVQSLFPRTVPTGLRHGTVTVLVEQEAYEVTTFRTEGRYEDHRRPETVKFVTDLEEDLARRDFTINAMALSSAGTLVDCFGGQSDLRDGIIRCVGNPERRFEEDALRMLRAIRFSAQLGFSVENETLHAASVCAPLCAALSAERVRDEMEKTLCSPQPEKIGLMIDLGLLHHLNLKSHGDLSALAAVPPDRLSRWSMACLLLPSLDLTSLRLDRHTTQICTKAAHVSPALVDRISCKRAIADYGWETAELAGVLSGQADTFASIRQSGDCVTLSDLAVRGQDFPDLKGPEISEQLRGLLYHVLEHPEDNQKDRLLAIRNPLPAGDSNF